MGDIMRRIKQRKPFAVLCMLAICAALLPLAVNPLATAPDAGGHALPYGGALHTAAPVQPPAREAAAVPAPLAAAVRTAEPAPEPPLPPSLSEQRGYVMLPHSAWKAIEAYCYTLNPTAGATTGSKVVYASPGYHYSVSLERVLERGLSGGFTCAGFVSWMIYNTLPKYGYGDIVSQFTHPSQGHVNYESVRFYHQGNDADLRRIPLHEAQLGDMIVYGGERNDHQHMGFYAGYNASGQRMIWHSGQDGVGRMRVNRMQTDGVLNYVAHVYSYFEPPSSLSLSAVDVNGEPAAAVFHVAGPHGFDALVETGQSGRAELTGIDLGRYYITDSLGARHIADVGTDGAELTIVVYSMP